ncbi:hypothetical protein [Klebsiella quasipneumoniae]|uniref:hypothetical protein n=1 Tax=Klebsiella quasipneumoniae TaxID=1463165 RepID=UPI000A655D46|nr:hypothetical protein [Klebsiella quasipneumoniae]HBW7283481.1 hypothetical protein [Klebsiella pneumoniae]EKZ5680035.1 hypothetical protein [Klebsiella quasipneumoniae]EMF1933630.1 hypothetical protein [Klebsiella quasipneumoniae]MBC4675266.1 hypothetical protein [Klebsiella quasipneumoniae]MCF1311060.1 hypothetical protein [Klebsiella quasipneumoniae]
MDQYKTVGGDGKWITFYPLLTQVAFCPEAVKTTEAEAIYYVIQHEYQAVR